MNKTILKQVAGIDVAQNELVVSVGKITAELHTDIISYKKVPNTQKGFDNLKSWLMKITDPSVPFHVAMEATGVYHERLAHFLADQGLTVHIILPNKMSSFMRTLDIKTITDKTASEAIMLFALQRNLRPWSKPVRQYRNLRQLTRERDQLVQERTMLKNQLHAEQAEAFPNSKSISRVNKRIALLNKQEQEIIAELKTLVKEDTELQRVFILLCTLPGVGVITAATILGETNGFDLINSKRQLTSYAGLDVKEKESGTSVKGKPCISKRGNRHLRKAMHLPALCAIRNDDRFKAIFARIVSKHGIKMKAAVAVQRKLLEMTFTLYKKNIAYDKEYLHIDINKNLEAVG